MPGTRKLDEILFYSTSKECFADYVDVDTVVMSMVFDWNLNVPDAESAVQIPNRAKAKSHTPFDAAKARMKDRDPSPAPPVRKQQWDPVLPVQSEIVDGSALSIVRQQVKPSFPHSTSPPTVVASAPNFGFGPNRHTRSMTLPPSSVVSFYLSAGQDIFAHQETSGGSFLPVTPQC